MTFQSFFFLSRDKRSVSASSELLDSDAKQLFLLSHGCSLKVFRYSVWLFFPFLLFCSWYQAQSTSLIRLQSNTKCSCCQQWDRMLGNVILILVFFWLRSEKRNVKSPSKIYWHNAEYTSLSLISCSCSRHVSRPCSLTFTNAPTSLRKRPVRRRSKIRFAWNTTADYGAAASCQGVALWCRWFTPYPW